MLANVMHSSKAWERKCHREINAGRADPTRCNEDMGLQMSLGYSNGRGAGPASPALCRDDMAPGHMFK